MKKHQCDGQGELSRFLHTQKPICVVLVDDHDDFVSSLDKFLSSSKRVKVAGIAHSGEEALGILGNEHIDLVLMDIFMKPMNGFEATQIIKTAHSAPKVIILSFYDSPELHVLAARALADGFVTKSRLGNDLIPLIDELFPDVKINETMPGA
jgi:DNA-binding NarL/FixJ family response regulator